MKNLPWILFDWNGTLLNDAPASFQIVQGLMEEEGLPPVSFHDYRMKMCFPLEDFYEALGFDFSTRPYLEVVEKFMRQYQQKLPTIPLQPGAVELLTRLKENFRLGVISAYRHDRLEKILRQREMRPFFETVRGVEDDEAAGKLQQLKHLLAERKIAPNKAVLVGDTDHDFETATATGLRCILVRNGYQHPDAFPEGSRVVDHLLMLDKQALLD